MPTGLQRAFIEFLDRKSLPEPKKILSKGYFGKKDCIHSFLLSQSPYINAVNKFSKLHLNRNSKLCLCI